MAALQKRCVACPTLMSVAILAGLPVESAIAQVTGSCEPTWLAPMTTNPYSPSPGTVAATTWDPDGDGPLPAELVLAGTMTGAGSTQVNGIARFDGTTWKSMPLVYSKNLTGVTTFEGTLVATCALPGDVASSSIPFRWNGSQWVLMDSVNMGTCLGLSVAQGTVWCVSSKGIWRWNGSTWNTVGAGSVYLTQSGRAQVVEIGGAIYAIGNVYAQNIPPAGSNSSGGVIKWNGTKWVPPSSESVESDWRAATVWRGEVILAGRTLGDAPKSGLLAFNGTSWRILDASPWTQSITAMIVRGDDLIVVGSLSTAAGAPSKNIARFDGTTWHPVGSGVELVGNAPLLAINPQGDLVVSGVLQADGIPFRQIARWDGTNWHAIVGGFNSSVSSLAADGQSLYAGGTFTDIDSTRATNIARWDGSAWSALPAGGPGRISAMLVDDGKLYVGGGEQSRFARWDGTAWTTLGDGSRDVVGLGRALGSVFATGTFASTRADVGSSRLVRVDGQDLQPLNDGLNSDVYTLTEYRGELIVGGAFTSALGVMPRSSPQRIARWDGTRAVPLRAGAAAQNGLDGPVYALATFGDSLIIAGRFNLAGGTPAKSIARWDGTNFTPMGDGFMRGTVPAQVYDVKVINGELYAAGDFTLSGSRDIKRLARWDSTAWQPVAGGVSQIQSSGSPTAIYSLAPYQGGLAVGGVFDTLAGTIATSNVALLGRPCPPCAADFDNDGFITLDDFDAFVTAFEHGSGRADQDGDGILTFEDFDAFIAAFEQGC